MKYLATIKTAFILLTIALCCTSCDKERIKILKQELAEVTAERDSVIALTIAPLCEEVDNPCFKEYNIDPDCDEEAWTCCDKVKYDQMKEADLIKYSNEYRDKVWSKTSSHFGPDNPYAPAKAHNYMLSAPASELDARFMQMSFEELDNYLCRLKSRDGINGMEACPEFLRFYYIRYDEGASPKWKKNRHSLAIVPVDLSKKEDGGTCFSEIITMKHAGAPSSALLTIENYNHLCPPYVNCYEGNRIYADGTTQKGILLEAADALSSSTTEIGCD